MHQNVLKHFAQNDPLLHSYIEKIEWEEMTPSNDYFLSLCREIIGQQLSGRVAEVIYGRFLALFPKKHPNAELVLKLDDETLRNIGMSWSKVSFIKDLAQKVSKKELDLASLPSLTNDQVAEKLTKVKGIGPWTAEMFLMFALCREDIFSHGDLGLKRAIEKIYGFKKEPTKKQIEKIVKNWSPYKTYASRILWKILDLK